MPVRKNSIAPGEYYHILARGVNKQRIFFDDRDFARFLFYVLFFQSPRRVFNIGNRVTDFLKDGDFGISQLVMEEIIQEKQVELLAFTLMENHIHLILGEIEEGGISKIMQRTLDGFSRYSHLKYKRAGHIFEGPFKAVHIEDNKQLLYLSTYIHKNPKEIQREGLRWEKYQWSSYQDFVGENRWGNLLSRDIILGQFNNPEEYKQFTRESTAKEVKERLDEELLI